MRRTYKLPLGHPGGQLVPRPVVPGDFTIQVAGFGFDRHDHVMSATGTFPFVAAFALVHVRCHEGKFAQVAIVVAPADIGLAAEPPRGGHRCRLRSTDTVPRSNLCSDESRAAFPPCVPPPRGRSGLWDKKCLYQHAADRKIKDLAVVIDGTGRRRQVDVVSRLPSSTN